MPSKYAGMIYLTFRRPRAAFTLDGARRLLADPVISESITSLHLTPDGAEVVLQVPSRTPDAASDCDALREHARTVWNG